MKVNAIQKIVILLEKALEGKHISFPFFLSISPPHFTTEEIRVYEIVTTA